MSAIDYASIARAVRMAMTGPRRLSAADAVRILATAYYGDDRWCLTINSMSDDEAAGRYATLLAPAQGLALVHVDGDGQPCGGARPRGGADPVDDGKTGIRDHGGASVNSDDFEAPEVEHSPLPETAIVLKVTGYDARHVEEMVAQHLLQDARKLLRERLSAEVESTVAAVVEELGEARIGSEVERVLAEGWQPVSEYGQANGPKKTLRDRISDILNAKDRYSSRGAWLDELVREHVTKLLGKDFEAEMAAAKTSFRKQVDDLLSGKIANGLRDAFGLRS